MGFQDYAALKRVQPIGSTVPYAGGEEWEQRVVDASEIAIILRIDRVDPSLGKEFAGGVRASSRKAARVTQGRPHPHRRRGIGCILLQNA